MDRPTRVLGRRAAAWLVDNLLAGAVHLAAIVVVGDRRTRLDDVAFDYRLEADGGFLRFGSTEWSFDGDGATAVLLVTLAWWALNAVALTGLTGGSLGKLLLGVRVVREDGAPCGFGRAALRSLLWVVDGFPYAVPAVGAVCLLAVPGDRRVGDLVAGTWVVRAGGAGSPAGATASPPPPAAAPAPRAAPAAPVPPATAAAPAPPVPAATPGGGSDWPPPVLGAPPRPGAPPPPSTPPVPAAAAGPLWDAARQAWLWWDGSRWLRHDPATGRWVEL